MKTTVNTDLKFSVDWLSVCVYATSLNEFLEFMEQFLPSDNDIWLPGRPQRFYNYALNLNGQKIISLEFNFDSDVDDGDTIESRSLSGVNRGILLNISGDGLRYLGSETFFKLIGRLSDHWDSHYTRIDLACDFFNPDNEVIPLILGAVDNTLHERVGCPGIVSRCHDLQLFNNKDKFNHTVSRSATIGKRGGRFTRIYDKCLEQRTKSYNSDRLYQIPDYWYRIELEVRPTTTYEEPNTIVKYLLDGVSLQECFLNQLNKAFRVDFINGRYDSYFRSVDDELWQAFLIDLSQNNYFVEFVYLEYVGRSVSAETNMEHYSNMIFTLLSVLPKDYVLDLYQKWLGFMQQPSSKSIKYRQQVYERKGKDFNISDLCDNSIFTLNYQYIPKFESIDELPW